MVVLAHISDLHPGNGRRAAGRAARVAGRPVPAGPGVVSTLRLPWEGAGGVGESLPPAIACHILDDEGRLTTHYRVIPGDQ